MSKILVLAGFSLVMLTAGLRGPTGLDAEQTLTPSWPQWRGPLASGVAPTGDPPTRWSETENVRWKVPVPGSGASTPIIWGDTIYLQTAVATGDLKPTQQNFTVDFQRTGESVYNGQAYVQSKQDQVFQLLAIDRSNGKPAVEQDTADRAAEGRPPSDEYVRVRLAIHRWHTHHCVFRVARTLRVDDEGRRRVGERLW